MGHLKLGVCSSELGRFDEARATLESLRAIAPGSTTVSTGLGIAAMISGDLDEARRDFGKTIAKDSRHVLSRLWLASLEEQLAANPGEALRPCEEAQRLALGSVQTDDCVRRNRARLATINAGSR